MSRITRDRIEPGDSLQSADLNTRFGDYTQTDIDENNVADAAFDSDHMPASAVSINMHQGNIGTGDLAHTTVGTVNNGGSAPITPTAVGTVAVGGGSGWTLSTGTSIRVYFNLQARSDIGSINPHASGHFGTLNFEEPISSGTFNQFSLGAHCWLIQLQWNIVSSALTSSDFVPVPGGGDFQNTFVASPVLYGERVDELAGVASMPAMWAGTVGWYPGSGGKAVGSTAEQRGTGWRNVAGGWVYQGTGQTVYGFRVVVHGVYHPYNAGGHNALVVDSSFSAGAIQLEYGLGNILAMHMRSS